MDICNINNGTSNTFMYPSFYPWSNLGNLESKYRIRGKGSSYHSCRFFLKGTKMKTNTNNHATTLSITFLQQLLNAAQSKEQDEGRRLEKELEETLIQQSVDWGCF